MNRHFKPAEPDSPWDACLFYCGCNLIWFKPGFHQLGDKIAPEMTYHMPSGMLKPTVPYHAMEHVTFGRSSFLKYTMRYCALNGCRKITAAIFQLTSSHHLCKIAFGQVRGHVLQTPTHSGILPKSWMWLKAEHVVH